MITAQGSDCVLTLENGTLTIVRFLEARRGQPPAGHSMRVLPAADVAGVDVERPSRWRRGLLLMTVADRVPGRRIEVVQFGRPQLPEVLALAASLQSAATNLM